MEGLTWGHDLNRMIWTLSLFSCHAPSTDPCLLYQDQWNSSVPATHYALLHLFADSHVDPPSEHFFPFSPVCQFLLTFILSLFLTLSKKQIPMPRRDQWRHLCSHIWAISTLALVSLLWFPLQLCVFLLYSSSGLPNLIGLQNHLLPLL